MTLCAGLCGCGKDKKSTGESEIPSSSESEAAGQEEVTEEQVKDTTPPVIELGSDAIICEVGKSINYNDYFSISDDTDDVSAVSVEVDDKKIDYSNPGEYVVSITATDSSNNKSSVDTSVYIYKDYTKEEIEGIIKKLIDEKFFDFEISETLSHDEDLWITDYTAVSNTVYPVVGSIDWNSYNFGCDVEISKGLNGNSDITWGVNLELSWVEWTIYGELDEIEQSEIVSKAGKMRIPFVNNIKGSYGNAELVSSHNDADYKEKRYNLCFQSEDDIKEFEKIINGNNPSVSFIGKDEKVLEKLQMTDSDVENLNSAIAFYKELGKYICNIPRTETATQTDADEK